MTAVKVFISYSHNDDSHRDELVKHLRLLERQGLVDSWHDRRLEPGQEWSGEIDRALEEAHLILLLVSADFLASDFCYELEMKRALERHEAPGPCAVVPVIVRAVDWRAAPFAKLQAVPRDGKAVASWPDRDEAWTNVASGIRQVAERIREELASMPPPVEVTPTPPPAAPAPTPTPANANAAHHAPEPSTNAIAAGADGEPSPYALLAQYPGEPPQRYELVQGASLLIGRAKEAGIRLPRDDKMASRRHAVLEVRSDELVVVDLISKNDTYVNDHQIDKHALKAGDRIRCGRTVLTVELDADEDRTQTILPDSTFRIG